MDRIAQIDSMVSALNTKAAEAEAAGNWIAAASLHGQAARLLMEKRNILFPI